MNLRLSHLRLILLGLALTLLGAAPALQNTPTIILSLTSGPPGATVNLSASGFTPNQQATILWDGNFLGTTPIQQDGTANANFNVPSNAAPGSHQVTLCANCLQGGEEASASFEVLQSQPTATFTCE